MPVRKHLTATVLIALWVAAAAAGQSPEAGASSSLGTGTPTETPSAPVVSTVGETDASYRIGSPDVLTVEVFDEEGLSGAYQVAPDGMIMFPLLGQVPVAGLTVAEATNRIHDLLERDYLYEPRVSLAVKDYRSQKVEILGSVGRPGTYYLKGETSVLSLLAEAGGVAPSSTDVRRGQMIRIVRTRGEAGGSGAEPQTLRVDLFDLLVSGLDESNVQLEDGDLVYVTRTEEVHVVGEIKRPGSYPYEEGMTVLKAMSLAGGATNKASLRKVFIRRIRDGEEVRIKAAATDQVLPEDTVEVPLGFW